MVLSFDRRPGKVAGLDALRGRGYASLMTTRLLAAALLLLAAPAGAASRLKTQRALVGDYLADARRALRACRDDLEFLQELAVTPHSDDEPVESALLHLDLADAYLVSAEPELFAALDPGARGGAELEPRLREALALLRRHAPDLADVYRRVPIRVGVLEGAATAEFNMREQQVSVRGYFAVSPPPVEVLAALLAHEATHALQYPRGARSAPETAAANEREARRRESMLWLEVGAGPDRDFWNNETDQARALSAGPAAFRSYVSSATDLAPDWAWVDPHALARPPVASSAPAPGAGGGTPSGAAALRELDSEIALTRRDRIETARAKLGVARERVANLTEIAAPFPKIATADVMRVWALMPGRYPRAMFRAFAAVTPALDELDKARAALAARSIDAEELARLENYASERGEARAQTPAARALAVRWFGASLPSIDCFPYPHARLRDPAAIFLPGAWQCRAGRPEIAAAWAAHVLAHRAQGLAPDAKPTLTQELEAVQASLRLWQASGADAGFDPEHPDRFLRFRVAAYASAAALKTYLESLGFSDPPPPSAPARRSRRIRAPRRRHEPAEDREPDARGR